MNVNGASFHLLLGRPDWARCLDGDDATALPLSAWWTGAAGSPSLESTAAPATLPRWDDVSNEITLAPQSIALPQTPGEAPLTLDARRSAAADRNGNIYRVGDDRGALLVTSVGSGVESAFWPATPSDCAPRRARAELDFDASVVPPAPADDVFLALATTCDDALVVAFARGTARGLMCFDLVAGGSPVETLWPASIAFDAFALCARECGGVWALDVARQRLWEFDRALGAVRPGQALAPVAAAQVDDFQPLAGPARGRPAADFPAGLDLHAAPVSAVRAIALVPLDDAVLLLDRDDANARSRVLRVRRDGATWSADASQWLDVVPPGSASPAVPAPNLPALAHDMTWASVARLYEADRPALLIATTIGNQAHPFEIVATEPGLVLQAPAELYPLRRFGGRALLSVQGEAFYDSGPATLRWTRIVQQPRQRYATLAEFVTPVFDSAELGTTWDKLFLDAAVPSDSRIEIDSRAGDDCDGLDGLEPQQVVGRWTPEPPLQLRTTGPELPWLRREAARATRRSAGAGTWELLLQAARGRYLQLRLRFVSINGGGTPRVRALRAWEPRFSYTQRFLPAVYREDPVQGGFLERWLANLEGTFTQVEDRIATLQRLFDARTVPYDALPWLAQWFDLALDPAWDERRHRLLVQRAMDFFRWRGTVHGLRIALSLAFDPCVDPAMFDGPGADDDDAGRIRIVEAFQARLAPSAPAVAADPGASDGLRSVVQGALWTPDEGNGGLVDRFARSQGRTATANEELAPFSLVPPADATAALAWNAFCQSALGFVPAQGAAERVRWQCFVAARYANQVDALSGAWGRIIAGFSAIVLPGDWPAGAVEQADWQAFCVQSQSVRERVLWADFLARRYRRIDRLQAAHRTTWPAFDLVPLPDVLPPTAAAQADWLQFERQVLAMVRSAHRFSVLLPLDSVQADPSELSTWLGLASRIVELEKPAHTTFDVRFYWAFNRVGEARLGLDTQLGAGSRAPELIPDAVVGAAYLGASFVGGARRYAGGDRLSIEG